MASCSCVYGKYIHYDKSVTHDTTAGMFSGPSWHRTPHEYSQDFFFYIFKSAFFYPLYQWWRSKLHLHREAIGAARLWLWRPPPATDYVILQTFSCLNVPLECSKMKRLIHCKHLCVFDGVIGVQNTVSSPGNNNLTQRNHQSLSERWMMHHPEPLRHIVETTFGWCFSPLTACFQFAECSLFNCLRVDVHLLYSISV